MLRSKTFDKSTVDRSSFQESAQELQQLCVGELASQQQKLQLQITEKTWNNWR